MLRTDSEYYYLWSQVVSIIKVTDMRIGIAESLAVSVECNGTNNVTLGALIQKIKCQYDMTPQGIIERLGLLDVDYNRVSSLGHFGKCYPSMWP